METSSCLIFADIFETASKVSTPLGLLGLAIAALLVWQLAQSRRKLAELKSLPESERAKHVDEYLSRYHISGEGLSPAKSYDLIREEMRRRFYLKIVFLVILVVAAVICFAIAAAGFRRPGPGETSREAADRLASSVRKSVKLRKPSEPPSTTDYLGVVRVNPTTELTTFIVWVQQKGQYATPWATEELTTRLIDDINNLKDTHEDQQVKKLQDIQEVHVINPTTEHGRVAAAATAEPPESLETFVQLKADPIRNRVDIRFFVENVPPITEGSGARSIQIVQEALASWQEVLPAVFTQTDSAENANVIISTGVIDGPEMAMADSTQGPPVKGEQLRMTLDIEEPWSKHKLKATVAHELGHILGLRHTQTPGQLMGVVLDPNISTPQGEDIALARQIWGTSPLPPSDIN